MRRQVMSEIVAHNSTSEHFFVRTTGPFRDILFPTDFSKSSEAITDHAVGLAKATDTKVRILSVVPRLDQWHGASEMYFGPFSDSAIAAFERERNVLEAERLQML